MRISRRRLLAAAPLAAATVAGGLAGCGRTVESIDQPIGLLGGTNLWDIPDAAWRRALGSHPLGATGSVPPVGTAAKPASRTKRGIPVGGIGTGAFMLNLAGSFGPWNLDIGGDDSAGSHWGSPRGSGFEDRYLSQAGFHVALTTGGPLLDTGDWVGFETQRPGARVLGAKPFAHLLLPDAASGSVLGDFLEEIVVRVEEKESRGAKSSTAKPRSDASLDVFDAVSQCKRKLLDRGRASLANVITADRDRVESRRGRCAKFEGIDHQPQRRLGRIDVLLLRDIFLENVVLQACLIDSAQSAPCFSATARYMAQIIAARAN